MAQTTWSALQGAIRNRSAVEGVSAFRGLTIRLAALKWLPLALVVALAVTFRAWDIGRVGLNSDEAVYSGQGAALFGDATMAEFFSVFRAHPLLLQTSLGALFSIVGVSDVAARLFVALAFGTGSVILTYLLASKFYGQRVAIAAGGIMALLPYHVMVSRQVLVDIPLAFFVLLTLWFVSRCTEDRSGAWLPWAGLAAGLAVASKEVGVLLIPIVGGFLILTGGWRTLQRRQLLMAAFLFAIVVAPYPISRLLFSSANGSDYLLWQFSRPPNHDTWYFFSIIGEFGGLVFAILAGLGVLRMMRRQPGDILILLWIGVFLAFFQLWPTKLFQYLVVIIPGLCIAAGLGLEMAASLVAKVARKWTRPRLATSIVVAVALVAVSVLLGDRSMAMIRNGPEAVAGPLQFDIEVQTFAGGRELGHWAKENTPPDARFMTIGPSIGNILRFYGHRDSVAISISTDPRRRNPAYVPIPNPDLWIRQASIHYIVWDHYSADRSAFYNARLMRYVRKYGSTVVYGVYQQPNGSLVFGTEPPPGTEIRILVYDIPGGDPPNNKALAGVR